MEAQAGMTQDRFRVNHLRRRLAELTVHHEDELAEKAIQMQLLAQQKDELQQSLSRLSEELQSVRSQLEEAQSQLASLSNTDDDPPAGELVSVGE